MLKLSGNTVRTCVVDPLIQVSVRKLPGVYHPQKFSALYYLLSKVINSTGKFYSYRSNHV
nr:hypothetical protein [Desulfobacterales bacterium]